MSRATPKPAVPGGTGRIRRVAASTMLLLAIACTGQGSTRGTRGALSPARPGPPTLRTTVPTEARLALTARVAVELSSLAGAAVASIVDATGTPRHIAVADGAVRLDGGAPRTEVVVRGPVRIRGTLHRGDARVTHGRRRGLRTIRSVFLLVFRPRGLQLPPLPLPPPLAPSL